MKIRPLDTSFAVLAAISLLNLNGAILMAVGIPQAGSPFLLLASLTLVWKLGSTRLPISAVVLLMTLAAYLFLSLIFSVVVQGGGGLGRLPIAYTISILMLWATMVFVQRATNMGQGHSILRLMRNLSLVAAGSVLASPLLYSVFLSVPPSAKSRFGGFFGNPNEAGVMACVAVIFLLSDPLRSKPLQVIALSGSVLAALLTFSKTAWVILPLILALHIIQQSRRNVFLLLALLASIPFLALLEITDILEWVLDNSFFELNLAQERRVQQVLFVLTATAETGSALTGRDFLWQFGMEQIMQNPFAGNGLGSFHHLEGGLLENGVWQGVHNTYLMVWGEAGIIAFLLFLIATVLIARDVIFRARHPAIAPLAMTIFLNLQVNHNILTSRYFIVLIGMLVCLQALPSQTRSLRP